MHISKLVRWGGAAATAAGLLLATGQLLNLGGNGDAGTTAGHLVVIAAHALLAVGVPALYAALDGGGRTAAVGFAAATVGNTVVAGVVYGEVAAAAGAADAARLEAVMPTAALEPFGALALLLGFVLLGLAVVRSPEYPAAAGWSLVAGASGALLGGFTGFTVFVAGAVVAGAALAWIGTLMWAGEAEVSVPPHLAPR